MKAWRCAGGLKDLALAELPPPVAGAGELVVQVAAGALNFSDLLMLAALTRCARLCPSFPGRRSPER